LARVEVTVIDYRTNFVAMALESFMRSLQVDLFDAQFLAPAGVVVNFTPRFAPFVVTAHRWDILEFPYRWPLAKIITSVTLKSARGIVAVGRSIFDEVMKFSPRCKVTVVPNAIDTRKFRPDVESGSLRQKLGIPEDHRVVLSVGHLIPRKGFLTLLQAMTRVMRLQADCSLVIVGDGPLRNLLEKTGKMLGLDSRFRLVGAVPDSVLPAFYAMADVFVMPSLSEGHCVSILEAMSSGNPIIASRIAANEESVVHGQNGLLVPPADIENLTEAILHLLSNDDLRESFSRRSRERAVEEFRWDTRARRLTDFYESVLE
jgi:glycosyltransferase involved in cell wall biosynthesis